MKSTPEANCDRSQIKLLTTAPELRGADGRAEEEGLPPGGVPELRAADGSPGKTGEPPGVVSNIVHARTTGD